MLKNSTPLAIKIGIMFGSLVSLIILNGLYLSYQWTENTEQWVARDLESKLNIADSVLWRELDVFDDLSSLVRKQRLIFNDLMDEDNYRALNIQLQQIATLYDADLLLLIPFDGPIVSSHFFNELKNGLVPSTLIANAENTPSIEVVSSLLFREQFAKYAKQAEGIPYLCFKSVISLRHDSGNISGHVIIYKLLNVHKELVKKMADLSGAEIRIHDRQQREILSSFPAGTHPQLTAQGIRTEKADYFTNSRAILPSDNAIRLSVAIDSKPFAEQRKQLVTSTIFPFVLTLGFSLILFLFLQKRVFKKVLQLIEAQREVTEGNLSVRLPIAQWSGGKTDEIKRMGLNFNIMMDRLADLYHQLDTKDQLEKVNNQLIEEVKERRKVEVALLAASQAKSVFLANMSHEIRTPMNAILGYTQILQTGKLDAEQHKALHTIEASGTHLLNLINDILDISKIEAGRDELHPEDFDLHILLLDLADMFKLRCTQKGLAWHLEYHHDKAQILVHGDQGKLRQILINLLGNAVKFTDSGWILLCFEIKENRYHFLVGDSGAGIPEAAQATIFDPFQQDEQGVKKGGTGLGLSISKKYVELMGGHLKLIAHAGKGAHFSFHIPFQPVKGQVKESSPSKGKIVGLAAGNRATVLVVDDNEVNRIVLCTMLAQLGIETREAEDGSKAVACLQQGIPDLIFMDYRMPDMDGAEATQQIHKQYGQQIPIVMVSASVYTKAKNIFRDAGCRAMLFKPFRAQEMHDCLADILDIEFLYETKETVQADDKAQTPVIAEMHLPKALLARIQEAAELGSITELDRILSELAQLGEQESALAKTLRKLAKVFDMDGILALLEGALP